MYFDHSTLASLGGSRHSGAHAADSLDPDAALELKRLQAAAREIGELATQAQRTQGAAVTVAWLRHLTREVDRLQACWLNSLQEPPPRRRRDDMDSVPPWR